MPNTSPTIQIPEALTLANNLPTLPQVAMEVVRLTQDENTTIEELALILGQDPALAAKLLKLSNSSLFGHGQAITTLHRAVMQLGLKTVKLMSLSFSLASSLATDCEGDSFDYREFWHRSLVGAVSARNLALPVGGLENEAFLCGLLRHIGRVAIARCLPVEYDHLATLTSWPTLEEEHAALGFSSSDVSHALAVSWGLPEPLVSAIGYSNRASNMPESIPDEARFLVGILGVSSLVEEFTRNPDTATALTALSDATASRFGWSDEVLHKFLVAIEPELIEVADTLEVEPPVGKSHATLIDEARAAILQVSLSTTADLNRAERRSHDLESRNRELHSQATTDKLTGLPNRAAFDDFLDMCVRARMEDDLPQALGVVMVDVDKFKKFNDDHGHPVGDEVLRMVARVMSETIRDSEFAARYGGEEFVIVLPLATPFGTKSMSERLRKAIQAAVLQHGDKKLSVTASFGGVCATKCSDLNNGTTLLRLADKMLYRAKANGRNRTEIHTGTIVL